jgi:hypothetical protein
MTPRIGADEGDLDDARIADGLDVRARRSAAEHTLHTYLPYARKTKEICGRQRVAGFRFTIFSPPLRTAASGDSLYGCSALAVAEKPSCRRPCEACALSPQVR